MATTLLLSAAAPMRFSKSSNNLVTCRSSERYQGLFRDCTTASLAHARPTSSFWSAEPCLRHCCKMGMKGLIPRRWLRPGRGEVERGKATWKGPRSMACTCIYTW